MNFIFIVSDTFRFDNLACYTKQRPRFGTAAREVQTPHLDAFANRCAIFERAYTGSFPTIPNRKDMFTGQMRPFHTWGILKPEERTFIAELVKAGYVTQMITDTYHLMKDGFNFARDFDGWEWIRGQENDRVSPYVADVQVDPAKSRTSSLLHAALPQHQGNLEFTGRRFEEQCYCAQTMNKAVQWLEHQYSRSEPFFLYVDTFDPHEPFDAPQWYEDLYDPGYCGFVNRFPKYGAAKIHTKAELNHIRALYAAEVTLVDRWVGHLLETADSMGLMDNTCIVFVADHGFSLGEHDAMGKLVHPLYEEICHIPLLIHMPGQSSSRRIASLVQPVDLTATVLDLAGGKTDMDLQGISLRGALEGGSVKTRPYAFSHNQMKAEVELHLTISSREWSLVYPSPAQDKPSAPQLFHLATDPTQKKNVLKHNVKQARAMWDAYARWLKQGVHEMNTDVFPKP